MKINYKDIVIIILILVLVFLIIAKNFGFERQLQKNGSSFDLTCPKKNIKDIYNRYILYTDGNLYFNNENSCDLITNNIESFAEYDKKYVYTQEKQLYKLKDRKLEISVDEQISKYQEAYSNIKDDYDKFINVQSIGFVLKGNKVYYFNSIYLVTHEITEFALLYNGSEALDEVVDGSVLDSKIVDIYYDYENDLKKYVLIVKTEKSYYKKIDDTYNLVDGYSVINLKRDAAFTNHYKDMTIINSNYLIYKNKVWTW